MIKNKEHLEAVTKTFLFYGMTDKESEKILSDVNAESFRYRTTELISSPENFRRGLYLIVSGAAIVTSPYGDGDTIMRLLAPGEIFGAAALFDEEADEYVSFIRAKGRTEVLWISEADVERMITENSSIAKNYITFLSSRIRFLNRRISVLTAGSSEQRLACLLFELPTSDDGRPILPKMNKLASTLNLGRATLYRALANLESLSVIRRDEDGGITVTNPKALKKLFLQDLH